MLQRYVLRQAERRPEAVALAMGDARLTYGSLEEESNRIARYLEYLGLGHGDRVCLVLPKAPETIASMIGILKAGCVYVPIDVASPAPRVEKIVAAADPRLILTTSSCGALLDELVALGLEKEVVLGSLDDEPVEGGNFRTSFSGVDWVSSSAEPFDRGRSTGDPAHILFTSGSTGVPKGVVITHAMVIAFVEWAVEYFGTRSTDRISGHPPLHFDLSTFDIYGSFLAGAELHLVSSSLNVTPHRLAALIREAELTQWFSVPSVMTYLAKFDAVRENDFPTLERVLWCGEVLPTPILVHWMSRLPHPTFTNLYGPTEATIASSYYTVPEPPATETEPIPIGTPCAGEELLVLDDELLPTPVGEIGDLYIGGVGLSPGYWRDEEKTAAAFIADPRASDPAERIYKTGDLARVGEDDLVYFLGRADSQIKSRGYRIELGEIEVALSALDFVRECAVVGVETDGFEGTAICCAYAGDGEEDVEPPRVREALTKVLPNYMLPGRWMRLEELPKNVNGKIDRRRLKELFEEESAPTATRGSHA